VSAILSPDDLQALSDALVIARPDVCLIRRRSGAIDAGGAPTESWTTVATVDCRVDATNRQPDEGIVGGRATPAVAYNVALPYGTDVRADDRIGVKGTELEIAGVPGLVSFAAEVVVSCFGVS
jgi:head-tail adaptor